MIAVCAVLELLGAAPLATGAPPAGAAVPATPSEPRQEPAPAPRQEPPPASGWLHWPPGPLEEEPQRGFFPVVGSVASGGGLALGGGYRDYALFGGPVGFEASALLSVRGYQSYRVHLGLLAPHRDTLDLRPADQPVASMLDNRRHPRRGVAVYLDAGYRSLPRSRFYGIGPGSRPEDRTDYLLRVAALDLAVQGQLTPRLELSARAGVLDLATGHGRDDDFPSTGERFTPAQVPGLASAPRYVVAGVGAAFDTRDGLDARGGAVFLSGVAWRFHDTSARHLHFTRLAFDGRTYLDVPAVPGLLALRTVVATDLAGDAGVPFFLQNSLGGGDLLRAFGSNRWQDRALAHATLEWRVALHPAVEIAPFVDAGTVGRGLRRLGEPKACAGVGLRARWGTLALGRVDWARGSEGSRVVFDLGAVF